MKNTTKQIARERLEKYGVIDNFYFIDNRITTRLSEYIRQLRVEGMKIVGDTGKNLGKSKKNWKNYYYMFEK